MKEKILNESYQTEYGARPIRRYLEKHVETDIAMKIVKGEIKEGVITIDDTEAVKKVGPEEIEVSPGCASDLNDEEFLKLYPFWKPVVEEEKPKKRVRRVVEEEEDPPEEGEGDGGEGDANPT